MALYLKGSSSHTAIMEVYDGMYLNEHIPPEILHGFLELVRDIIEKIKDKIREARSALGSKFDALKNDEEVQRLFASAKTPADFAALGKAGGAVLKGAGDGDIQAESIEVPGIDLSENRLKDTIHMLGGIVGSTIAVILGTVIGSAIFLVSATLGGMPGAIGGGIAGAAIGLGIIIYGMLFSMEKAFDY